MNRSDFVALAERALAAIPGEFLQQVENLSIQIEDWADPETLAEVGFDNRRDLLGFYRGLSLDERGFDQLPGLPDVIVLYQRAIEVHARESGEGILRVIRETLVHELAHYFGFSEEEMKAIEAIWADPDRLP
jgi:predicted Zn-dependent protease with MMP-like domain